MMKNHVLFYFFTFLGRKKEIFRKMLLGDVMPILLFFRKKFFGEKNRGWGGTFDNFFLYLAQHFLSFFFFDIVSKKKKLRKPLILRTHIGNLNDILDFFLFYVIKFQLNLSNDCYGNN